MMRGLLLSLSLSAVILVVFGCASAASGGSGGATSYRKDLGTVTPHDFSYHTRRIIIERYQYEFEQEDSSASYQSFKTRWRQRILHEDEIAMGVVAIRTQLTVRARSRGGASAGIAALQSAELIAENMARMSDSPEWILTVMTPLFKEYIDEIAQELKTEFSTGIRVY